MDLEHAMDLARALSARFSHHLGPFETVGTEGASAECRRPGCNMGLTVRINDGEFDVTIIGMAAAHYCAAPFC